MSGANGWAAEETGHKAAPAPSHDSPTRADFAAASALNRGLAEEEGPGATLELLGSPSSARDWRGQAMEGGLEIPPPPSSRASPRVGSPEPVGGVSRASPSPRPPPPSARQRTRSVQEAQSKMMAYVQDLTEDPHATHCGIASRRPLCLQRFASQGWMLFWLCWYCTVQGLLVNGLVPSVLTSIERRFEFNTSMLGTIMQFYDVGYLLACIPVSYFGGRHSKPLFIGAGLVIIACGSFLFSLPHLMSPLYTSGTAVFLSHCPATNPLLGDTTAEALVDQCGVSEDPQGAVAVRSFYLFIFCLAHFLHGVGATPLFTLGVAYIDENVKPTLSSLYIGVYYAFAIFGPAIGFLLSGSLLRYHTDFLAAETSVKLSELSESDPEWVGAWWVGFHISAVLALCAVGPILSFPKILPKAFNYYKARVREESLRERALEYRRQIQASKKYKTHRRAFSDFHYKQSFPPDLRHGGPSMASSMGDLGPEGFAAILNAEKDVPVPAPPGLPGQPHGPPKAGQTETPEETVSLVHRLLRDVMFMPRAVSRLLSNPCYLFITLAASIDALLVTGFSAFMAKYMERQFNMSTSRSAMLIGSIMVPVAGLGTMASGYVIKRFRLTCPATLKFCVAMVVMALVLSPMFLVYCNHSPLIGVETRYPDERGPPLANASGLGLGGAKALELAAACNARCDCRVDEYNPVCASYEPPESSGGLLEEPPEGLSFYSPCYAGCAGGMSPTQKEYEDCSCAPGGKVKRGLCESKCSGLVGFLVLFGPMCFCTFSVGVPALSVVLRCVDHSERAFALGIQWILIRLIGTIPASSVFGWLFDISCLRRYEDPCSGEAGTCYVYNNKLLADLFLAFALIGQTGTLLFLVLALVFYRPKPGQASDPIKSAA